MVNAGKYTIHGFYGSVKISSPNHRFIQGKHLGFQIRCNSDSMQPSTKSRIVLLPEGVRAAEWVTLNGNELLRGSGYLVTGYM